MESKEEMLEKLQSVRQNAEDQAGNKLDFVTWEDITEVITQAGVDEQLIEWAKEIDSEMTLEMAWGANQVEKKPKLIELINTHGDIITEFLTFLVKEGYCDSDVYTDPPIDNFFKQKLKS